jgi:hypothetical protein
MLNNLMISQFNTLYFVFCQVSILNMPLLMQVLTFADMEGGETFDASLLGNAEEVVEERVSDDDVILIKGAKSSRAVSC